MRYKYVVFLRLYFLWILLSWFAGLYVLIGSREIMLAFTTRAVTYPAFYIISRAFSRKYDYYFTNQGSSPLLLLGSFVVLDLAVFTLVAFLFKLLLNA